MNWRPVIIIVVVFVLGLLAVRDLPYVLNSQGVCMIEYQPSILLGASPSWEAALACA